jgi:hypothetical protein
MSQENVAVVRRVTDVMDTDGFEAASLVFLEAAHPDVELREDPAWPGSGNYRGVEQVRQLMLDRMDTLDFDQQTEELIAVDDIRWPARVRPAHRLLSLGHANERARRPCRAVREKAITKLEFFIDRAEALEAAGLRDG